MSASSNLHARSFRWRGLPRRGVAIALTAACALVSLLVAAGPARSATPYAYVANKASNTVTPINIATNFTSNEISVGKGPTAIAITPDGKKVYVANSTSNTVTSINTATNTAGNEISVGKGPSGIAITPDGKTAYVTNFASNTVTPIDTASNVAGTEIKVGKGPTAIAITPDGTTAYVTSAGTGTVTPITLATGTAGTAISVGSSPEGIAITPDGKTAYVSNYTSGTVTPITLATNTPGSPIPVGTHPASIAITPDGKTAYVTNASSSALTPISTATNTAGTPIVLEYNPASLAVTPDGASAYVTLSGSTVSPIALGTKSLGSSITVGSTPYGIAITPDQAPVASFTVTPGMAGSASSFDASASTVAYGLISNYHWSFGDGETAETATPTTTHTYAVSGNYTVTLTATDSAGTSTTQVFTGQTMSRNGGAGAQTTHGVTIVPPPPVNTAPPTISGTVQQGQKLTEHNGSWTNVPTSYTYRWLQCDSLGNGCLPIAGATSQTYVVTGEDVGHTLAVQETASNAGGSSSPATSSPTAVVIPLPPQNTAPPTISGLAQQGQTLSEAHGSWTNSATGYSYQWLQCNGRGESCSAIAGATGQTYVLVEADLAHTLRVQETAANAGGSSGAATSAATAAVVPPGAPVNTVAPTISGTTERGQTLTEHQGSWTNSPTVYSYQWLRCDAKGEGCAAIPGATSQSYALVEADVAHTVKVQETVENEVGSGSPAESSATAVVVPPPPVNTAPPTIEGTAQQSQALNEAAGTWTNSPTGYGYQWLRCDAKGEGCVAIGGATSQTYVAVAEDVGHTLSVRETASNAGGAGSPATSAATALVLPAAPENTFPPTISGTAQQGQTLTGHSGAWTNSPTAYGYQWLRCDASGEGCAPIAGATSFSYTLGAEDVGRTLRLREGASNAGGAGSPAASSATARVHAVPAVTPPPAAATDPPPAQSPPANPTAAPAPTAVVISAASARLTAHGEVLIQLICPRSAVAGCRGTITLALAQSRAHRHRARAARCARGCRSLGSGNYEASSGKRVRIRVHMASFGRKLAAQRKSLRVTVTATSVSGEQVATTRRTITLRVRH
jgi:YVTN family beta-propeller protein